jgi:hypothetical protein
MTLAVSRLLNLESGARISSITLGGCLIVFFAILSRPDVGIQAVAQEISAKVRHGFLPANEPYSLSYAAGGYDAEGNFMGGTELMNLAAFEGKLYAGVGYVEDQPNLLPQHPDPASGAQIVVKDAGSSPWRQEMAFDETDNAGNFRYLRIGAMNVIAFHRFDAAGNVLGPLAEMLVVGLDIPRGAVYTQVSPGNWVNTQLPTTMSIRSPLTTHLVPGDTTETLFAGAEQGDVSDAAIYRGVYDRSALGSIRWNPAPETIALRQRVMSMVDCNGALFAAVKPSIFRRNDRTNSWEVIYTYPITYPFDQKYSSGFRGLTCIKGPGGNNVLLSGFEGVEGDILTIDPQTGLVAVELDSRQFLTHQWGSPPAIPDIVAGHNDIPLVNRGSGEIGLFGLLTRSPKATETNSAWFFSRTNGNPPEYQLHEVSAPPNWPYQRSNSLLLAIRTIAVSPFPEDQGQVLYMGGYDVPGYHISSTYHNTAWLYRVGINTALEPYPFEIFPGLQWNRDQVRAVRQRIYAPLFQ